MAEPNAPPVREPHGALAQLAARVLRRSGRRASTGGVRGPKRGLFVVRKTISVFLVGDCLLGRWVPAATCVVRSSSAHRGKVARLAAVLPAAVLVCLVGALTAPAAAGTSQPLRAFPAPRQAGLFDVLASASCNSATACTAVGYRTASTGTVVPLAETWNGQVWSVEAIPA